VFPVPRVFEYPCTIDLIHLPVSAGESAPGDGFSIDRKVSVPVPPAHTDEGQEIDRLRADTPSSGLHSAAQYGREMIVPLVDVVLARTAASTVSRFWIMR
jgi:hypothetical protein